LNTRPGVNVAAGPPLSNGSVPVTITFAQVFSSGKTTLTKPSSGPPLPTVPAYSPGASPTFYDLSTTATFTMATVCANFSGFVNNSAVRLLQFDGSAFVDKTTSVNQLTRVVCGAVSALGLFTLAETPNWTAFDYTSGMQTYIVPAGVTAVDIDAFGAQGGAGAFGRFAGGLGGRIQTTLAVTPGASLFVFVGGAGNPAGVAGAGVGGFNGGGNGGSPAFPANSAGGGGGASDVRLNGLTLADR